MESKEALGIRWIRVADKRVRSSYIQTVDSQLEASKLMTALVEALKKELVQVLKPIVAERILASDLFSKNPFKFKRTRVRSLKRKRP